MIQETNQARQCAYISHFGPKWVCLISKKLDVIGENWYNFHISSTEIHTKQLLFCLLKEGNLCNIFEDFFIISTEIWFYSVAFSFVLELDLVPVISAKFKFTATSEISRTDAVAYSYAWDLLTKFKIYLWILCKLIF